MSGELVDQEARQRHFPTLMALGCAPRLDLADQRHRLGDRRPPAVEIEPSHAQRGHLPESSTGIGEEEHDEAVLLAGLGETVHLLMRKVLPLGGDHAWKRDVGGRIADESAVLDGGIKLSESTRCTLRVVAAERAAEICDTQAGTLP